MKPLTKADEAAIARLPEGWFEIPDVSYMVRSPRFRCDRLVEAGMLETRIAGRIPHVYPQYRKLPKKPATISNYDAAFAYKGKPFVPVRIQLSRAAGWRMPEQAVKVDRTTKWGNPYKVGDPGIRTNADAKLAFFNWTWRTPEGCALAAKAEVELRGKHLACWCKLGAPCHADVWLDIANR